VVNMAFILAQGASLGASLVPLYYAVAIMVPIVGGFFALKRYADNQRKQNVQQGIREGQLVDRLDANTKAADKNTASIEKLGAKFDSFSSGIDKRLTLADYRIDKLEEDMKDCTKSKKYRSDGSV
jgi:hypothetical protein